MLHPRGLLGGEAGVQHQVDGAQHRAPLLVRHAEQVADGPAGDRIGEAGAQVHRLPGRGGGEVVEQVRDDPLYGGPHGLDAAGGEGPAGQVLQPPVVGAVGGEHADDVDPGGRPGDGEGPVAGPGPAGVLGRAGVAQQEFDHVAATDRPGDEVTRQAYEGGRSGRAQPVGLLVEEGAGGVENRR
ncbi:hypothetical protein ABGB18_38415 [Nonomuraea sp. B12E4]|uniref:hypothetical protein n=1 Tax=Nonomuraea sp. B12E4 TaxID=3153564 RepID=UPI00325E6E6C